jgi:NitT/TauT family transport system substrate-binding protein
MLAAKAQGYEVNVITLADQGIFLPTNILVVHEDLLKANPDLVRRFVRATIKGWDAVVKDQKAGLAAILKVDETLNVTEQTNMLAEVVSLLSVETASLGHMDGKMWQQIKEIALANKLISGTVESDKAYTAEYLPQ